MLWRDAQAFVVVSDKSLRSKEPFDRYGTWGRSSGHSRPLQQALEGPAIADVEEDLRKAELTAGPDDGPQDPGQIARVRLQLCEPFAPLGYQLGEADQCPGVGGYKRVNGTPL
jgi:hypothetical protein